MKTVLNLFLLVMMFSMTFISCKNNDDEPFAQYNSITTDGVLSGKIVNIINGEVDAIKVFDKNDNVIGTCNVASDGSFSVTLPTTMSSSSLYKTEDILDISDFVGTISDESTKVNMIHLVAYKNNIKIGYVGKCNFFSLNSDENEGSIYSGFIYSDRLLKIIGKNGGTEYVGNCSETVVENYNITLKKGWNEITHKTWKALNTSKVVDFQFSISDTISSDMKWRYFPESAKSVKSYKSKSLFDK